MARPTKKGLDYFSHDVDYDAKLENVISKFGEKGHGIITRIWQHIYKNEGYYMEYNEDELFMIQRKCADVTIQEVESLITEMIKKELFCKHLFVKCNIITSKRLQENFEAATKRRPSVYINLDYLLLTSTESTQRKEKESKEDNITLNNTKLDERIKRASDLISQEYKRPISPSETKDLTTLFNDLNPTDKEIQDAVLIAIQRRVQTVLYLRGIIEKDREGFKYINPPNLKEVLGDK